MSASAPGPEASRQATDRATMTARAAEPAGSAACPSCLCTTSLTLPHGQHASLQNMPSWPHRWPCSLTPWQASVWAPDARLALPGTQASQGGDANGCGGGSGPQAPDAHIPRELCRQDVAAQHRVPFTHCASHGLTARGIHRSSSLLKSVSAWELWLTRGRRWWQPGYWSLPARQSFAGC